MLEHYLNTECNPTEYMDYLDKNNYLSEYSTLQDKEKVRENLGIQEIINKLDKKIDDKVIEKESLIWDQVPTEGHTNHILSSDALYNVLLNYSLNENIDSTIQELWNQVLNKINQFKTIINEELNESNCEYIENIKQLEKQINNFTSYVTQQINYIKEKVDSSSLIKIKDLEKRIKSIEVQLKTITSPRGTALTDVFGNSDSIGITQRTLTNALNRIWEKIGEMSGENYKGITFNLKPEYFIGSKGCTVHVTASTQNTSGIFEKLQLYLDGELIAETSNTEYFEYDFEVNKTSTMMCKATILGIEYTKIKTITHYDSIWIGAGKDYQSVMIDENIVTFDDNLKGNYNITFDQDDKLFVITESSFEGFIRADMNGMEIPMSKNHIVIDDIQYNVYTSKNTYNSGRYNIDINS